MRNYNFVINEKGLDLQLYAERVKLITSDLFEWLSKTLETDEDIRQFCYDSKEVESRADIIFDYVTKIEQIGKIIECLSGKLLENERREQECKNAKTMSLNVARK